MPRTRPALCCLIGLWVGNFTDWSGMYVLNSHAGTPPGCSSQRFPRRVEGFRSPPDEAAPSPRKKVLKRRALRNKKV
jgi:hypothetical protein